MKAMKVVMMLALSAALIVAATWTSLAADEVKRVYHYVGNDILASAGEFITLFNYSPHADARVRIEVTTLSGVTQYQFDVPRASHLVLRSSDLGITGLYYLEIRSTRLVAVSIIESFFVAGPDELGGVTPQDELFSSYALANTSSANAADDFFRIYAPVTPTTVEFYDQDLKLVATRTISGNGLAEFRASDLGYTHTYSAFIKAAANTPHPFAISFLEGPAIVFSIIPQGVR